LLGPHSGIMRTGGNRSIISPKEPSRRGLRSEFFEDPSDDIYDASNGEWLSWLTGWCHVDPSACCASDCVCNFNQNNCNCKCDESCVDMSHIDCCIGLGGSNSHFDDDSIFDSEGDSDYGGVSEEYEYTNRETVEGDMTLNLSGVSSRRGRSSSRDNNVTSQGVGITTTATATTTTFENGTTSSIKHGNSVVPVAIPLSTLIMDMGLRSVGELHHAPDVELVLSAEPPIAVVINDHENKKGNKNSRQLPTAKNIGLTGELATERLRAQGHLCASELGMGAMYLIVHDRRRRRGLFEENDSHDNCNDGTSIDRNNDGSPDVDSIVPVFYDQRGNEIDEDYGRAIQARPLLQPLATRLSNIARNIFSGYSGYTPGNASVGGRRQR